MKEACRSSGMAGEMTFGRGQLDEYGYWEFPDRAAAEQFDKEREERLKQLGEDPWYRAMTSDERKEALHWATAPAWPPANYDYKRHREDWKKRNAERRASDAEFCEMFPELADDLMDEVEPLEI